MNLHDQHYRKLFSSPAMVRALFHGFLPQRLRHSVDLDSLAPLPSSFISSSRNRDRRADCIWQVKRRDGSPLYLLILLEHQSRADRFMSIRMLGYSALLYEDIIMRRSESKRARLPSILPIVLYTGARPWNAPLQASELLDKAPAGLRIYQPQMRYLVLDEGKLVSQGGLPRDNLATLLFQLEHNQGLEHIQEIVRNSDFADARPSAPGTVFSLWSLDTPRTPAALPARQYSPAKRYQPARGHYHADNTLARLELSLETGRTARGATGRQQGKRIHHSQQPASPQIRHTSA